MTVRDTRSQNTVHHLLEIAAPRQTVFAALTTAEGLSGWWTTKVEADEAAVGAGVRFTFRVPFNPRMRIVELDAPARVAWDGAGGHDAWGPTSIRFDLVETNRGTTLRFSHRLGGEPTDDRMATVNFNWGYYLDSLRRLCETGRGKPYEPGAAAARVGADALA